MNALMDKRNKNGRVKGAKPLKWFLWIVVVHFLLAVNMQRSFAQEEFRSLTGQLHLDVGVADRNLDIRVTVRNHSLVVLSVFPFILLRPVTSKVSATVVMVKGTATTSYSISQIIENPVDYTIQIECLNCNTTIPNQYYTSSGNRFGLGDSAYIDPAELPTTLDIEMISHAKIAGSIELDGTVASKRDLFFTVSAVNSANSAIVYQSIEELVLAQGASSLDYQLTGLDRAISPGYRIQLRCTNCFGSSAQLQTSSGVLSGSQNHQAIDFLVTDLPFVPLPSILQLLL